MNSPMPNSATQSVGYQPVLVALCGLSPAVITETVWALAHEKNPVRVKRIIALTTKTGRHCIHRELFESGIWDELRQSLNAEEDEFLFGDTADSIRVVASSNQRRELDDITTVNDSAAIGDFILDNIRQVTENSDNQLIFSLAGGRKTMSALGALSMTLLARRGDRLCHVLVPEPFEKPQLQPKFYFPSSTAHVYEGNRYDGSEVNVVLHDIPFIRGRDVFRKEYARLPGSFRDTVAKANRVLEMPHVTLRPHDLYCDIDGVECRLGITEYAFFWMLCHRCANGEGFVRNSYLAHTELKKFVEQHAAFLIDRSREPGSQARLHEYVASETDAAMEKTCRKLPSRIKEDLRKLQGIPNIEPVFPIRGRGKGYGLVLPPENITILEE